MKRWLARAAAATSARSEEPRNRFARRTARWFRPARAVPAERFQDAGEPYPDHWRRFPEPWQAVGPDDPEVRDVLAAALAELPPTWREVLVARDVSGRDPGEVGRRFDLTPRQQRAILNRARAELRDRLAQRLDRNGER